MLGARKFLEVVLSNILSGRIYKGFSVLTLSPEDERVKPQSMALHSGEIISSSQPVHFMLVSSRNPISV
jgi:hypothetical protein